MQCTAWFLSTCVLTLRWCLNLKAFPQSMHLNLLRSADSSWEIMCLWRRYTLAKSLLQTRQLWNSSAMSVGRGYHHTNEVAKKQVLRIVRLQVRDWIRYCGGGYHHHQVYTRRIHSNCSAAATLQICKLILWTPAAAAAAAARCSMCARLPSPPISQISPLSFFFSRAKKRIHRMKRGASRMQVIFIIDFSGWWVYMFALRFRHHEIWVIGDNGRLTTTTVQQHCFGLSSTIHKSTTVSYLETKHCSLSTMLLKWLLLFSLNRFSLLKGYIRGSWG